MHPYLYLPGPWEGDLSPSSEQIRHLVKVLRFVPPFAVEYGDGAGNRGRGEFIGQAVIRGPEENSPRPVPELTVAVAPPDDRSRQRFLVEKLSELGCARLCWLRTRRTVGRPPSHDKARAWGVSAFEQSRGTWLMDVVQESVDLTDIPAGVWYATPGTSALTGPIPDELTVAIGPEGGWADGEVPQGAVTFGLGDYVLRTETAAVAAVVATRFAH